MDHPMSPSNLLQSSLDFWQDLQWDFEAKLITGAILMSAFIVAIVAYISTPPEVPRSEFARHIGRQAAVKKTE